MGARASQEARKRREWRWPLLGVVSVLLPALVFAALAYRAEQSRHDDALGAVRTAEAAEVSRIYLEAQSDDWDDVVSAASTGEREAQEGLRGLKILEIGEAYSTPGASLDADASSATVVARIETARVQANGDAPGQETIFISLVRKGGRWYVSGTGSAP